MPASFRVALLAPCSVYPTRPFFAPVTFDVAKPIEYFIKAYGGVSISINANIETVQALHSVDLVVAGAFRMYMPVKVDRAMSHRRPVSHGEMAKGQLLLVVL